MIDHSVKNSHHKNISESNNSSLIDLKDVKYKKKVLGYLLKKNPQQFQQLNKNLNEVSRLFGSRLEEEAGDSEKDKQMDSMGEILAG